MHLGNMVLLNDEIHVFDCLEFNPRLSWTDVIAEISFLVMDFQERGQPEFAFRFLNRWLEETGDYGGLAVWKWYFAYRAMVRAKVAALRVQQPDLSPKEQDETRTTISRYLNLAESQTRGRGGPILLMHGFSGSGKSFVAERLCEELGAVRVRSDVERKRLQSTSPDSEESAASRGLYAPDQIRRVYQEILIPHAETIVSAGFPAIIDATFLRREQRNEFRRLASRLQVPLTIVDVTARLETLHRRLATRADAARDPSDADVAVLELQKKTEDPIAGDELAETITIDTESDEWRTTLVGRLKI
jgi:predicted kinase